MKKIAIFVCALCFFNTAFSQDYTPMLEIGKIWNMRYHTDFGSSWEFDIVANETVVIDDLTYFHIEAGPHPNCDTFLREDINEKKIYALWDNQEHLIYDFSLDIGDNAWFQGMLVTDIGYGDFYGMTNLRYYVLDDNWKLIEGIGMEWDGIAGSFGYSSCVYGGYDFVELINMNQTISVNEIASNKISIYPNPATDKLFINNSNTLNIQSIQLYDVLGKLVLQKLTNFQQLDVFALKSGVYLVRIGTDKGVITKKVIKKS